MMIRLSIACFLGLLLLPTQLLAGQAYLEPIFGYQVSSNIAYGTGATNNGNSSTTLRLDLYRPTDIGQGAVPANNPAIVLIHGGGFTTGNKNDLAQAGQIFATFGYTVASISYRLSGSNPPLEPGPAQNLTPPGPPYASLPVPNGYNAVNAAVNDATKAMQWMHDNAATYGFDPNRIGIGGASAGAVTALLQAYNNPAADVTPKVVLSFLGSMYGSQSSIQPGDAPAFIVAGATDNVVPPADSAILANELTSRGIHNELFIQPGVGHTVDYFKLYDGLPLIQHNINFLATYLVPEPSAMFLAVLGSLAVLAAARKTARRTR